MPVYLNAFEAGTDPASLGFPHQPQGLGVVAMTAGALFGVHLESAVPAARDGAVAALRDLMARHGAGPILALYGSCNHAGRYPEAGNRLAAWQAEMEGIARQLGGWHGPARGCNTGFIEPRPGTTIEYQADYGRGSCRIEYRRAAAAPPGQLHEIDGATRLVEFAV
ncbi:hypothetical protein E2C06_02840 [Dankookia rubra]|uniref:Uncharacterized protein n=1 Tax=Dankookia rubra TaxID=1442381 RepID=A0A4R5QNI7_9PROT|nr:hypothetical protein [Dankookia rubra]TDH64291.1 hypothetical protein E2C06_02840 [Dankookia rubra]